jgi:HK97 family phage major capsid protein
MSDPIDVTKLTTPALHAKIDEARKQATEIVDGFKAKVQPDQHWSQAAETQDVDRVKRLHGDVQILQQELNRRSELDGAVGDLERAAKAATTIATMPVAQPAADAPGFGPLTPGQAFVMSKAYQDAQRSGAFKLSPSQSAGAFPQFGVSLDFKSSFPMHRRLLAMAARSDPAFFSKGTAISTGASSGGGFILPDYDLDPEQLARASLDVVGLLKVLPTDSNQIIWLRQDTRVTGATSVAELTDTDPTHVTVGTHSKPEGGATWSQQTSTVTTIAVHVAVTNQQLDDAPEIRAVIDEDLRFEIEEELNNEILNGAGAGSDLTGILASVGNTKAYNPATPTHDNVMDAILDGWVEIKIDNEPNPTGVVININDYYRVRTCKADGTGEYLMGPPSALGGLSLWGWPLVPTNNIAEGTALVGNFQMARLHVRQQSTIKLGWAMNDFLANRIRLLAELRAALTVRRPNAFASITGLNS